MGDFFHRGSAPRSNVFRLADYSRRRGAGSAIRRLLVVSDAPATLTWLPSFRSSQWVIEVVGTATEVSGPPPHVVLVERARCVPEIRGLRARWACPIVVLLPPGDQSLLAKQAYAAGVDDILQGPVSSEELLEVLRVLICLKEVSR